MADPDLSRAVGGLEKQVERTADDLAEVSHRTGRIEERLGRLERAAHTAKGELGAAGIVAKAHGVQIGVHEARLLALEGPIAKAKADGLDRRARMRARVQRVGTVLLAAFTVIEWVAKPIVSFIAEQWVRGQAPPGH